MQKKIKIAYAYKGLTYLPLFLANSEARFNSRFQLIYTEGDVQAIDLLLKNECEIAICDPFAKDNILEDAKIKLGSVNSIKLIGCLINKSPIWIYREDPAIAPVKISSTDDLKQYNINVIKGYKHPNTGWIFCKELHNKLDRRIHIPNISYVNFNPDIEDKVDNGEILLTSNILKIAIADYIHGNGFTSSIYSYGCSEDPKEKLKDLFFTGIIAQKEKYKGRFLDYTVFCDELQRSIKSIYEDDIESIIDDKFEVFKEHVQNYPAQKNLSDNDRKQIFRNIIIKLRQEKIYPTDLRGNIERFDKMMQIRKEFNDKLKQIQYDKFVDYYVLNRTQGNASLGEKLLFQLEKINARFIKPLLNSNVKSREFIILTLAQFIPAIASLYISLSLHEAHLVNLFTKTSIAGIISSLIICLIVAFSNQGNKRKKDESGNSGIKLLDIYFGINSAFIFGFFFAILVEIVK